MPDFFVDQENIAGAALLLSFLSIVAGLVIVGARGKLVGLTSAFRGVEGIGEAASAHITVSRAALTSTLLQLVGFGVLATMLQQAGEAAISMVAYGLLIFASAVMAIEETFHRSVTVWAGQQWANDGNVPELYEPLRKWVNVSLQQVYMLAYLIAMAGFGWGVLRAGTLSTWVGWIPIAWSLLWLVVTVIYTTLPAAIIVLPLIFGIGLVLG